MIPRRATAAVVLTLAFAITTSAGPATAAEPHTSPERAAWSGSVETFAYLMEDGFVLPIAATDRGSLHFEARWQYEDRETFSAWAGRRFETGSELRLDVVAMAGAIVGRTDGVAPGVEASLVWKRFELYTEAEYVFDLARDEGDFFYSWSQLGWQATPWLAVGASAQRTRTYDSELAIERGIFATVTKGVGSLSLYGFNFDGEDPFAILAVGLEFEP